MTRAVRSIRAILVAALLLPVAAWAQEPGHSHAEPSAAPAVAQLALDGERKWATDRALRRGMAAIQAAFEADHPAIHAGTQSSAQYAMLAEHITTEVNSIIAECKLPPAADANLHLVIADLLQGASLMRGEQPGRSPHDGAARVNGAIQAYGEFFDDPDFRP